jgi:putative SOS response-associated peptidase YedK
MPSPVFTLKGRNSDPGVTNVRNVSSPHWRRWLGVESRCVTKARPLAFFAGIWTRWKSVRKVKVGETENDLFGS